MKLFDGTLTILQHALDAKLARHGVLAANVANADTPGYAPRDLDFTATLTDAQGPAPVATPEGALSLDGPRAATVTATTRESRALAGTAGLDGNTVDVDRSMAAIAQNGLEYSGAARAAQKKLAILRYVASDGAA